MEKWFYDDIDLCVDNWNIERVIDGLGLPAMKGSNLGIPARDGNFWIKKRFDSRSLTMSMWVRGLNRTVLDANIDALTMLFGKRGQHTLRRVMHSGEVREAQAEVIKPIVFVPKNPGFCKFAVEFELPDPFFYGETLISDEKEVDSTIFGFNNTNPGTAPINRAVITLTGPLDSPVLENITNPVWLQYRGAIAAGETVTINTKDFTCYKGNLNAIAAIRHGGDSSWLILESGLNRMKLSTNSAGGSIKLEYFPAYF